MALVATLAILVAVPARTGAQTVRGVVRDSATRQPVAGSVVIFATDSGALVVRTITDSGGRFEVRADGAARRVRVLHIGYRPADRRVPLDSAGAPPAVLDLRLAPLPTLLEPVRTVVSRECPRRADGAATVALLDQERAGVLATQVASEARPARMVRIVYERHFNDNDDITDQTLRASVDSTAASFRAVRTARQFLDSGFVRDSAGYLQFLAPDAATLVDPDFARGYCYHLVTAPDRPDQVGLAFEPARSDHRQVQVAGTLWADTARRELSDMEFHYLHLDPRMDRAEPGGRISFQQLPNGIVLIHRWSLRLPAMRQEVVQGGAGAQDFKTWFYAVETGGRVARASWPDGYVWSAGLASAALRIVDSVGQPVSGAVVRVEHTDYLARTDSSGAVTLPYLVSGPWDVTVLDSMVADLPLGVRPSLRLNASWGSVTRDTVRVESPSYGAVRSLCHHATRGAATSVLVGRVRRQDRVSPAAGISVATRWTSGLAARGNEAMAESRTAANDSGVYAVCGLPPDAVVSVLGMRDADSTNTVSLTMPHGGGIVRQDLVMKPRARAAPSAPEVRPPRPNAP